MKELFDQVSIKLSKTLTKSYSTSFSLGIQFLAKPLRDPIYALYGFVRLADEIVDSFHDFDKKILFDRFKEDVYLSISQKISLNPILNSFQSVVNDYNIEQELTDSFLFSMEMDLYKKEYTRIDFEKYVLGSAEVVGLMCLRVFIKANEKEYQRLKPYAMKLGAAYQKINFLRDLRADFQSMGRSYFPDIDLTKFTHEDKIVIEREIENDFREGYEGLKLLPKSAFFGVYLSYAYYFALFQKIRNTSAEKVILERIRISDIKKYMILLKLYFKYLFNTL